MFVILETSATETLQNPANSDSFICIVTQTNTFMNWKPGFYLSQSQSIYA